MAGLPEGISKGKVRRRGGAAGGSGEQPGAKSMHVAIERLRGGVFGALVGRFGAVLGRPGAFLDRLGPSWGAWAL